jgi:hypothetical protein
MFDIVIVNDVLEVIGHALQHRAAADAAADAAAAGCLRSAGRVRAVAFGIEPFLLPMNFVLACESHQ